MLDVLAIARTFTDAGMDQAQDQAVAVTSAVQQAAEHGDHVTRQDLDSLRADVRSEIAQAVSTLTWRLALVQAATIAAVGALVRLLMP